ncbi:MAG: glycine oxidase ThiO [Gammaproteobacteria bacterium]
MTTVVIGAGIIGLLCARSLARAGRQVILIEKTQDAENRASWAGGGMAMPIYPWRSSAEILSLMKRSYALYPGLVQELLIETGIDAQWYTSGILTLESDEYLQAAQWAQNYHFPLQLLLPEQINTLVPALASGNKAGIWLPTVAQVRNPRLLKALDASIQQNLNIQRRLCEVQNCVEKNSKIIGVQTSTGYIAAEEVVIAAGAWSGLLLEQLPVEFPIFPMRGQMLLWQAPAELLPCMIVSQGRYLIPRLDGYILAGSSMEDVGFDISTTEQMYAELYQMALSLVPALAAYPVVKHWAGLRPGSPQGIPWIGKVAGIDNLWINAGHFRNGLLMGPASNEILINRMLNG